MMAARPVSHDSQSPMTAVSATAAGFGGADQIVEAQRQWRLAQFKRQLIQLLGGSVELQQQGVEECPIVSDHGLLLAPVASLVFVGDRASASWSSHGLKTVQAVAQHPQVMAIELGPVSYTHLTLPTICSV